VVRLSSAVGRSAQLPPDRKYTEPVSTTLRCLAVTVVAGVCALPAAAQYSERVDVSVANVEVVVNDRAGNPVAGLTRDDFELYENGVKQSVTNFYAIDVREEDARRRDGDSDAVSVSADRARLFVLFVDIDEIEPLRRRRFFESLGTFMSGAWRDGDYATLVTWNRRLRIAVPPVSNRSLIDEVIDQLAGKNRRSEAAATRSATGTRVAEAERDAAFARSIGMSSSWDGEAEAAFQEWFHGEERCSTIRRRVSELRTLLTTIARAELRTVLILATDDLTLRPTRSCSTEDQLEALAATANAHGITIHAFHPPGYRDRMIGPERGGFLPRTGDPAPGAAGYAETLDQAGGHLLVARSTGGVTALGPGESSRRLEQIARELGTYYSLGYRIQPGEDDAPRRLRVVTRDRAHRVRARQAVVLLSERARVQNLVTTNLYLPPAARRQPLELHAAIRRVDREGRFLVAHVEVSVSAGDLALVPLKEGTSRGSFTLFVAAGGEAGDASDVVEMTQVFERTAQPRADERVTYSFSTRLRPDSRRLSIAFRDDISTEIATKVLSLPAKR
jgi:VWFA-related protein